MKTLTFTVLKDKLLDQSKKQTFRCLFIPKFEIGEMIGLTYKENGEKEYLYNVYITELYPKQIKDFTLEEARLDGFDSIQAFKKEIMTLNRLKSENQWGFIIRWHPCQTVIK